MKSSTSMTNRRRPTHFKNSSAFTIVELLIVIVVIAILAAITIVVYRGIQARAYASAVQSDLSQAATQLSVDKAVAGSFPTDASSANSGQGLQSSVGTTYQYTVDNSSSTPTFCLSGINNGQAYHVTNGGVPEAGVCTGHTGPSSGGGTIADGSVMQTITAANCPSTRTRGVDARDNHTYWVQKLADGKCWMLTNLAYAGGGTNTYTDTKTLTNGTALAVTYTVPSYYVIPSTTNYIVEPADPSTSTTGTGQYGYLYNWCAANGGQANSACSNVFGAPAVDTTISVCPKGWRLPTGNGGEQAALNTAINGGSTTSDAGLRTTALAQRSGAYDGSFYNQGSAGYWWSSTQNSNLYSYMMVIYAASVNPASNYLKTMGYGVRCVAI